jgi:hypothetical protein
MHEFYALNLNIKSIQPKTRPTHKQHKCNNKKIQTADFGGFFSNDCKHENAQRTELIFG